MVGSPFSTMMQLKSKNTIWSRMTLLAVLILLVFKIKLISMSENHNAVNLGGASSSFRALDLGSKEPGYAMNQCEEGKGGWIEIIKRNDKLKNQLILLTNANSGYSTLVANFIETVSKWENVWPFVVLEDCKAYNCLGKFLPKRYLLPPLCRTDDGLAKDFDSKAFGTLVSSRPVYIHFFLARSFDVFWIDVDSNFLGNPLRHVSLEADVSLIDDWRAKDLRSEWYFCSCFMFFKSNYKTLFFMEYWRSLLINGSTMNQWAFNEALNASTLNVDLVFSVMPRSVFPNGADYPRFQKTAVWAHANWRSGKKEKMNFLSDAGTNLDELEEVLHAHCPDYHLEA